jgi:trimethylamine:corrinoid methyltransferase-like protein
MRTVSDLAVYARLIKLVDELDALANTCASVITETALRTASRMLRRLASAVYKTGVER